VLGCFKCDLPFDVGPGDMVRRENEILAKVRNTISRHGMLEAGDRVIVGVSGGADSVCLLDILWHLRDEFEIELIVAHFDHGLRPHEDEGETRFVRKLASSMNLPFETARWLNRAKGRSTSEEKAREARYLYLEEVARKNKAQKIAVAHTLDDQAETVLMRLLRGSGATGLSGIPPCRDGRIVRPLLETARNEILAYLERRGLSYMTDSSNLEANYLRNRIRLQVMPLLRRLQPRLIERLGETAQLLREEDQFMDSLAREWVEREGMREAEREVSLPVSTFNSLSPALKRRVTRLITGEVKGNLLRIGRTHVQAVCRLASSQAPQGAVHLPGEMRVKKRYDRLIFTTAREEAPPSFHITIPGPGIFTLPEIPLTFDLVEMDREEAPAFPSSRDTALLDASRIRYPLVVRNPRPGDRFVPLGMKGHRKIKDFFIDLKVPSTVRSRTPLLCCGDIPVWVCGYRIDDRFKITPHTRRILMVTIRH